MIDLKIDEAQRKKNIQRCKEKGIVLPTYAQMRDPTRIPASYKQELSKIGLWDTHSRNLFRVTWHNEPKAQGGGFGGVNYIELPSSITGTRARVIGIAGKWFPTGAHKVGAALSCLLPELVTGRFDPTTKKAVWPSTGNYCRGGAYISRLLSCPSVAILPAGMSKERFEWLRTMAEEVIATPGCESNVKEIFDKCVELERTRPEAVIFNQFDQLPNHLWHYAVTGPAMEEVFKAIARPGDRVAGAVLSSGSAGTLGAGSYLRDTFPGAKVGVAEALQCPTILENGFGDHRIEGIGDKHIPWIHNLRDTDAAIGVDDELPMRIIRLFNEGAGRRLLQENGVSAELMAKLDWIGISGVGNLVGAIKMAKYYELTEQDVVFTVFTDSMELYGSRLTELTAERGAYDQRQADRDWERLTSLSVDHVLELSQTDKRRVHNLKYFTWIEQLGKDLGELRAQWDDYRAYWGGLRSQVGALDKMIEEFNAEVLK
ncbi:MAG: pyridoxal-5-phosphate-dependent protein subunit beta [Treponema sp. GWB1_62_6]|nr:MAG: pyridoxal-5-phosphate-dependent protein subunit beta [Treponema sp. GWB1_62_6]OHE69070.1 MAG: pyridoxal-5-phosphate-dependent protein subunit beta [Treponema sp. GWC1_61_84]OHE70156.1 MAG: pyridoxal-5-phosphate-dependent protein subunit beta [Treponema sp. RIFOXYC1_FULL_61_9]HCM27868.1 pyridoxal-5-phosphate-dependent protein subunit beta [Treponema sp.]